VLKAGPKGVNPFHWELEFPEVFRLNERGGRTTGFNAFVGNPPFLGGKKISTNLLPTYRDWLAVIFEHSNSNSDLVSYFFRRTFELLNLQGGLGLIATNSVFQGATRATGLYYIVKHGGVIFAARKRVGWPGEAAVEVCIIHIWTGPFRGVRYLNGRAVANISAFLVEKGGDDDPFVLHQNGGKSFIGYELHGKGFMFDNRSGEANPMSVLEDLGSRNPSVLERVSPFIGGAEVNENPLGRYPRLAMNFGSMTLDEALQWPELVDLLRQKVKPTRISSVNNLNWWQYKRPRPEMAQALAGMAQTIVCSRHSVHFALTFMDARWVLSDALVVFGFDDYYAFCILQSRIHELWALFFGSTLEDRPRYSPTLCFETFPFPRGWRESLALRTAGEAYYRYRAELISRTEKGLTETYNRFHDKGKSHDELQRLRDLHAEMDRAVLDAYGWTDLRPRLDFILDYEVEDEESSSGNERKERWRYRWIDEDGDKVLARLLELNRTRAEEEEAQSTSAAPAAKTAGKPGRKKSTKTAPVVNHNLFEVQESTE
jgi:hypothetical protein